MKPQFINSIIIPLSLFPALFLGALPLNFAPAKAQVNNTSRLSKYSPLKAPFLRTGSRGQAVRDVQAVLQSLGFYNGAIDGVYGTRTARAVARFQREQRLVGDGQVGVLTWQALRNSRNVPPVRGPF